MCPALRLLLCNSLGCGRLVTPYLVAALSKIERVLVGRALSIDRAWPGTIVMRPYLSPRRRMDAVMIAGTPDAGEGHHGSLGAERARGCPSGRREVRERDFRRHQRRKPARCRRTTVYGWTTTSARVQRGQIRDRSSQKTRSIGRSRGLGVDRRSVPGCWRRSRFSRASSARVRRAEPRVASTADSCAHRRKAPLRMILSMAHLCARFVRQVCAHRTAIAAS